MAKGCKNKSGCFPFGIKSPRQKRSRKSGNCTKHQIVNKEAVRKMFWTSRLQSGPNRHRMDRSAAFTSRISACKEEVALHNDRNHEENPGPVLEQKTSTVQEEICMGKLTSNLQRQLSSISMILGDRVETQMEELSERQESGISSPLLTRLSATDRPAEPPSDPLQEWLWKNSIKLTCRVPPRCVVKGKHEAVGPLDFFNTHSPCASPLHLITNRNSSCQGNPPPADGTDKLDKPVVPAVSTGQEDKLASHVTSKAASPVTPAKESSGNLAAMQNGHTEVELDVENNANSPQKGSAELSKETQILSVNLQDKAKSQDQPHEIQSWKPLETQSRNISQMAEGIIKQVNPLLDQQHKEPTSITPQNSLKFTPAVKQQQHQANKAVDSNKLHRKLEMLRKERAAANNAGCWRSFNGNSGIFQPEGVLQPSTRSALYNSRRRIEIWSEALIRTAPVAYADWISANEDRVQLDRLRTVSTVLQSGVFC